MNLANYIKVYDNALPGALCDQIIERFDRSPDVAEGKVGTEQGPHRPEVRSCLELNVARSVDFVDLHVPLTQLFHGAIKQYRQDIDGYIFPEQFACEQFRMKKYRADAWHNDQFAYHVDVNSHASARRFLVCFWYLNDVAEGGETSFPHLGIKVQPKRGRVLVFPPLWMYPHSGDPPESNDKYILGTYAHYL